MYCSTCSCSFEGVFEHDADDTSSVRSHYQHGEHVHHQTFEDLLKSAHNGCLSCRALIGSDNLAFKIQNPQKPSTGSCTNFAYRTAEYGDMREITLSYNKDWLKHHLAANLDQCQELEARRVRYIASEVVANASRKWQSAFRDRSLSYLGDARTDIEVSSYTGSWITLHWIKSWLNNCGLVHTPCADRGLGTWLPSRLIYVGDGNDEESTEVRLCITGSDATVLGDGANDVWYTTLSHRWGPASEMPTLTKENLARLCKSIEFASLPLIFQHAIEVTRTIGLSYIWIDSLCIVQDDANDWAREGASMSKIYQGSTLNISSEGRSSSSSGLFATRDPNEIKPFLISNTSKQFKKDGTSQTWAITPENFWTSSIDFAPLNQRAWVLQERVLSPRVVHFGAKQVFWECLCKRACETFPGGIASGLCGMNIMGGQGNLRSFFSEMGQIPKMNAEDYWSLIVNAFTACGLTRHSDKLIALAGIATQLAPKLKQEYIAGMWRGTLVTSLLWHVQEGGCRGRAIGEFVAPSWSWASIDGPVSFPGPFMTQDHYGRGVVASLLEYNVAPRAEGSPYGQVTVASITLRSGLGIINWTSYPEHDGSVLIKARRRTFSINLAPEMCGSNQLHKNSLRLDEPASTSDQWPVGCGHQAYFLAVYSQPSDLVDCELRGLVLQKLLDGRFERIGMMEIKETWARKLVRALEQEDIVLI